MMNTRPDEIGELYLAESAYKVVLQKSVPAQIRQLLLYISNRKDTLTNFCGS